MARIVSCATPDPCNFGSTSLLFTPAGQRSHSVTCWLSVTRFVRFDPKCGPICSAEHYCSWSDLTNHFHHKRAVSTKGSRNCPAGYSFLTNEARAYPRIGTQPWSGLHQIRRSIALLPARCLQVRQRHKLPATETFPDPLAMGRHVTSHDVECHAERSQRSSPAWCDA